MRECTSRHEKIVNCAAIHLLGLVLSCSGRWYSVMGGGVQQAENILHRDHPTMDMLCWSCRISWYPFASWLCNCATLSFLFCISSKLFQSPIEGIGWVMKFLELHQFDLKKGLPSSLALKRNKEQLFCRRGIPLYSLWVKHRFSDTLGSCKTQVKEYIFAISRLWRNVF